MTVQISQNKEISKGKETEGEKKTVLLSAEKKKWEERRSLRERREFF